MDHLASWPPGSVKLIFCWAHVWRKFFDFHCATASPTVSEALRRTLPSTADRSIARSHPPAGEVARWPLVDTMKTWLDAGPGASRSNPLARAICSAPRHWIRASLKTGVLKSLRTPLSAPSDRRDEASDGGFARGRKLRDRRVGDPHSQTQRDRAIGPSARCAQAHRLDKDQGQRAPLYPAHAPPHPRAILLKRQNVVYISRNCRLPAENVEKDLDAP